MARSSRHERATRTALLIAQRNSDQARWAAQQARAAALSRMLVDLLERPASQRSSPPPPPATESPERPRQRRDVRRGDRPRGG